MYLVKQKFSAIFFCKIRGLTAPLVADRSSQAAASDSDAASRQQTQIEYIASSDPRLVEKIVARGSWLVKSLPLYSDGL